MSGLRTEFAELQISVERLLGLLEEAGESFWQNYLTRGQHQIVQHKLSGATYVLGCFGGANTLSDLVIGREWMESDPQRFANLNARLGELRTAVFTAANQITSRQSW